MRRLVRSKHFYYILVIDAILVAACFYAAYLFRFEFSIPARQLNTMAKTLPFLLLVKMVNFYLFRLYHGMWRYTSLVDMMNVAKAVFTSSILIILGVLMIHRFQGYPRSVFLIDMFLAFMAIAGIRVAIRLYFTGHTGMDVFATLHRKRHNGERLLIIGAGDAGEKVLREIRDNPVLKLDPVGFLDDDPAKQGLSIHGIPILGMLEEIDLINVNFDEILIALPTAGGEEMRRAVELCHHTGKPCRTVPSMGELINGKVSVKTIRKVTLEDFLGREEVHLDQEEIAGYLKQKRIMVTGAGGSIGSELVRQICPFNPQALALVDMNELNLFRLDMECKQHCVYTDTAAFLVDIRRKKALQRTFQEFHPDVVFHAAAYKHVPIQELHPWEAVYNNTIGTKNVAEEALKNGVERFVLVSTDKAVRPANVMGATKRVAEMIVGSMNGGASTRFMSVRFGNVIGSSGSAIRIFQKQISRGGPVTVTHPDMTRYFMSIPEAAQLILQAGAMGEGGEIFILEMGKPVRILDVARDVIRLHGFEPDRDIPIQFIGLRPGEKLYEELITEGEGIVRTGHRKILVLKGNMCEHQDLNRKIDGLLEVTHTYDPLAIKRKLMELVPDYTPPIAIPYPKRAEEAFREGKEQLATLMDSSADSFFFLDSELNFAQINKAGLKSLNLPEEEVIGKNILDIVPNLKETGRYDKYLEVIKTGRPCFSEDPIHDPELGEIRVPVKVFKVGDGLGIVILVHCRMKHSMSSVF